MMERLLRPACGVAMGGFHYFFAPFGLALAMSLWACTGGVQGDPGPGEGPADPAAAGLPANDGLARATTPGSGSTSMPGAPGSPVASGDAPVEGQPLRLSRA